MFDLEAAIDDLQKKELKKIGRPRKNLRPSLLDRVVVLEKAVADLQRRVETKSFEFVEAPVEPKEPEWTPWTPSKRKPETKGRKVAVLLRNGEILNGEEAKLVELFTWAECGDRTIIAYAVV